MSLAKCSVVPDSAVGDNRAPPDTGRPRGPSRPAEDTDLLRESLSAPRDAERGLKARARRRNPRKKCGSSSWHC